MILDDLLKKVVEEAVMLTLDKVRPLNESNNQIPNTMTTEQLAVYLGMSIQWVYKHTNELPHLKLGRKTLFLKEEIDEWRKEKRETKENLSSITTRYSKSVKSGFYKVV